MPAPTGPSVFEQRVELYDALIDWPKRLANETPFYRHWFETVSARRVLDAACGSGRHAALFHEWGLHVEGADASPAMIAWCRRRYGETADLRWVERSYTQPPSPPGRFDAVICVGNSLALSREQDDLAPALAAMLASLRPGGVCIVQVLNLWRLPDGPTQYPKCVRVRLPIQPGPSETGTDTRIEHRTPDKPIRAGFYEPGHFCEPGHFREPGRFCEPDHFREPDNLYGTDSSSKPSVPPEPGPLGGPGSQGPTEPAPLATDHVLLKSIRRAGSCAFIELVDVQLLPDGTARREVQSDSFVGLRSEDLAAAATAGGATGVAIFGNYQHEPYAPERSPDIILVCRKA